MAVALVIFAKWNPINCLFAALLFGGAGAIAPVMQVLGVTEGRNLFDAAPVHPHAGHHDRDVLLVANA